MFYESERIIRKNQKHVKSKAYQAIREARAKGLNYKQILCSTQTVLEHIDNINETNREILNLVCDIAKSEMENTDDETNTSPTSTSSMLSPSTGSDS